MLVLSLEALAEFAALLAELLPPEVHPASRLTESAAASSRESRRVYFMANPPSRTVVFGPALRRERLFLPF